jgi:hypothetical protein
VVIGLRAAGSAKGNFWLDSALKNRAIASLTPVSGLVLTPVSGLVFSIRDYTLSDNLKEKC